jgi:peptidoglycan/LPS O-acetylase OafA/YrhL
MKPSVNPSGNIEGLQVLRAVAALMVVMHHARLSVPGGGGWPSFGASGVDIFFVISGFVMAYTTAEQTGSLGARLRSAGRFLRKRAVRIVPLYWLALLWTARKDLLQGRFDSDLAADFFFVPHPNAMFHSWLTPTLQQGWTLNYEAFFYVLFAVAILFGSARIGVLLGALAALAAAGWALAAIGWPADIDSAAGIARRFYGHDIVLEFGYGVLLERLAARRGTVPLPVPRPAAWIALVLGFILIAFGHDLPPRALMEGVPAALIVWAGIQAFAGVRAPVLELLGAASYSIYLFHWASFGAVKPIAAALARMPDGLLKVNLLMAVHFAIALAAGLAIHVAIEKPFMRWATRRFADRSGRVPAVLSA